jgi:hypothetical protein
VAKKAKEKEDGYGFCEFHKICSQLIDRASFNHFTSSCQEKPTSGRNNIRECAKVLTLENPRILDRRARRYYTNVASNGR